MRFPLLLLAVSALCACSTLPSSRTHERRWAAVVAAGYAVPADTNAFDAALELSEMLGERDPLLRDDYAFGILAQWIVQRKLLGPDELRELSGRWTLNLVKGIGDVGDQRVLLRSFSALCLSLIAARDLQEPFRTEAEVRASLDSALKYLAEERDLRDFEPELGWIHATAHTADWLKFLARHPKLDARDLDSILAGIGGKLTTTMSRGFSMGEDERLARAVISVVLRTELDPLAYDHFLRGLLSVLASVRGATPDVEASTAVEQNILHFLRAVHAILAGAEGLPPHAIEARDATLRALARG